MPEEQMQSAQIILPNKVVTWKRLEKITAIVLIVVLPFVGGMLTRLIGNALFSSSVSNGVVTVRPGEFAWYGPGFILGFGLIGYAVNGVYKLYLKRKHTQLSSHTLQSASIDGYRFAKPLLWIAIVLALVTSVFIYDNYLRISEKEIVINELTQLGRKKVYPLAAIKNVRQVTVWDNKKQSISHSYYSIRFSDGYEFRSRDELLSFNGELEALCQANKLLFDKVTVSK